MDENTGKALLEPTDKEISLRYLVSFVAKKRRAVYNSVLAVAFAGLLLICLIIFLGWSNEEYRRASRYEFDNALSAYKHRAEALENEIVFINNDLSKQQMYCDKSILMNTDPYQKTVTTLDYYVDSGYQIIPENTYQDIDYSSRLISMYLAYLTNGELYSQLLAQMPEITDEQYIKELISVTADYETSIITIMVAGDIDNTQQMIDTIRTGMETVYSKASDTIAEHKLTKISDSVYTVVDLELAVQQQENFNRIYESSKQLQDKMVELKELEDEGEPQWEYSWWSIVKQLVKYLVIAASLGLLAAVLAIAAYYITSDKILDVDKLQAYSNISILGVIPRKESKPAKMKNGTGAIQQHANSSDSMMTLTAQSIYTTVLASGAADGSIALAGSLGSEVLQGVVNAFNQAVPDTRLRFVSAGDPMRDIAAVETISAAKAVVFVEKQGVSRCSDVVKENARVLAWGKPVLGAVLLDADAQ